MKNTIKAQAAHKVQEAMAGLRDALRRAAPDERREIHACMCELRNIKSDLDVLPDDSLGGTGAGDLDGDLDDEPMASMDSIDEDGLDDLDDGDLAGADGDEDMDDDELALSALELAASALRAAAADDDDKDEDDEDEDEEEDEDESEDDGKPMSAASDDDEDHDEDDDSDDDTEDDGDHDEDDDSEESDEDEESDSDEDDDTEDYGDDDSDEGDEDGDEDEEAGDDEDMESEDSEEVLTPEELDALRKEGLVGGSVSALMDRLAEVQARLGNVKADGEAFGGEGGEFEDVSDDLGGLMGDDGEDEYSDAGEDSEEILTSAQYREVLASLSADERRELRMLRVQGGADISAKKISKSAYALMQKKAARHRALRKFRGPWHKSAKGKKASIRVAGGDNEIIKKHWYFSTYSAKGKFMGVFWMSSNKPPKETTAAYKEKHGVPHPSMLPKKDEKAIEKMKKKPGAKKPAHHKPKKAAHHKPKKTKTTHHKKK